MAWFAAAHRLGEHQRAVRRPLIAGARLPSSSYFPLDCATISRRLENASR